MKEKSTDLWVYEQLKQVGIEATPQGSSILEVANALKTASKKKNRGQGYPEYVAVVNDFLLIFEDKADISKHIKLNEKGVICESPKSTMDYAVNGALHYGKHLAKETKYTKIFAFGVSGSEKHHKITPLFINERGEYKQYPDVESFIFFNSENIEEYYLKNVLKEQTKAEKTADEIKKSAKELHEKLRNYGSIQDKDKPLIVSGILLALNEERHKNFSVEILSGDEKVKTDGDKIYDAIKANLDRAEVSPQTKKDKLLSQFSVIKDSASINQINDKLHKTPLRYYVEFIKEHIYESIYNKSTADDYLGLFYSEFMSYSGGDGQTLGIILTPRHITELFCDLIDIKVTDRVFDPCCGTAGFLISAMHHMMEKAKTLQEAESIKKEQLHGLELQPYMFTIASTNMILRGDGKSNLEQDNFLSIKPEDLEQNKHCNVGMMNPPYSQGSKQNPSLYEINFTEHLLDSLTTGGRAVVIIPQSSVTGKTKEEQKIKESILKKHTLEGVITLNKNTFYGVGTNPCIAVFTAGVPHDKDKRVKFINFENDGYEVQKHIGLVETNSAKDKKQHLLDVWFDKIDAENKFCVKTTIEADDEWLHSFYYFNDEIPSEADFEKVIADYLTFEVNMITHGRGYLFGLEETKTQSNE